MSKGLTFYFMRHGETYFNVYGRVQGWCNAPLTEKGIEDIKRSGRGLAAIKFDAVYASDLQRTRETAEIAISQSPHADKYQIETFSELREVNFGYFEGLPAEELYNKVKEYAVATGLKDPFQDQQFDMPQFLKLAKLADPYHHAENYVEFWNRVESGLLTLLNRHAGTDQKILVVSHGLTIANLIHGLVADYEPGEPLKNASISIVEYRDGQFHLTAMNKTDHFKD